MTSCRPCQVEATRERQATAARRLAVLAKQAPYAAIATLVVAGLGVLAMLFGSQLHSATVALAGVAVMVLGLAVCLFFAVLTFMLPFVAAALKRASEREMTYAGLAAAPALPPTSATPGEPGGAYRGSTVAAPAPAPAPLCGRHAALARQHREALAAASR